MAFVPVCALDDCRKWHHRSAVWQRAPCSNCRGGPGGVIATILAEPAAHIGKTYPLCGPTELGQAGIAAAMTDVLGRKISYQPLTIPQYRKRLEKAGLPESMIQHFCAVALDYQNGLFSGEDKIIAELTGKPPMTVRDFVASHREAFTTASAA
jgi:NAD(P)H dehydrogenase (quinone)